MKNKRTSIILFLLPSCSFTRPVIKQRVSRVRLPTSHLILLTFTPTSYFDYFTSIELSNNLNGFHFITSEVYPITVLPVLSHHYKLSECTILNVLNLDVLLSLSLSLFPPYQRGEVYGIL